MDKCYKYAIVKEDLKKNTTLLERIVKLVNYVLKEEEIRPLFNTYKDLLNLVI